MHKSYFLVLLAISSIFADENIAKARYFGSKYLILPSEVATFVQAQTMCRNFGMKLVTVSSHEKNVELYNQFTLLQMPHDYFWIGAVYQNNSMYQGWTWTESETEFSFTDWTRGHPIYSDGDNCIKWGFNYPSEVVLGMWLAQDCRLRAAQVLCEHAVSSVS